MKNNSVLIVDDNQDVLKSLKMFLKYEFEHIHLLKDPQKIISTIRDKNIEVVLLDMNFDPAERSGEQGIAWLSEILSFDPCISVIMLTAYADVNLAVEAIKKGAMDFVVKPWDNDKLVSTIQTGIKLNHSRREVANLKQQKKQLLGDLDRDSEIIWGDSRTMKKLKNTIHKVASTNTNVLVSGENGTGKELVAKYIHLKSNRADKPFIKVDMGTINENIFESEMFGHVKGAYTDAKENRIGRFELADGGTLFMDEIGNLPLNLQAKMLTAIQNRTIQKVGSNKDVMFDVRIIAATNKNIEEMVMNNLFRQDLLYRLKTIHLSVPPLREREGDVIKLAEYFLDRYRNKYDKPKLSISYKFLKKLQSHSWPGNIRELEHSIERAVILSENNQLNISDFQLNTGEVINPEISNNLNLNFLEKKTIKLAIEKHGNNLSEASRELGISRPTLYKKIKNYKIHL